MERTQVQQDGWELWGWDKNNVMTRYVRKTEIDTQGEISTYKAIMTWPTYTLITG